MTKEEIELTKISLDQMKLMALSEGERGAQWLRISPRLALSLIEMARAWLETQRPDNRVLGLTVPSPTDDHT